MKLFRFRLIVGIIGVAFFAGFLNSYLQFNPWGQKKGPLEIYVEKNSPLITQKTKSILEFYFEREVKLSEFENIRDLRTVLVQSTEAPILIFSSWAVAHQLQSESLIKPWSQKFQDLLYTEMRLVPEFFPMIWDLEVQWKKNPNAVSMIKKPHQQYCSFPENSESLKASLPLNADWNPEIATFETDFSTSALSLWGFSIHADQVKLKLGTEKDLRKFIEGQIFEPLIRESRLGLTLKKYESFSETPRLRRSSFLKDIPLSKLKIKTEVSEY